MTLVETAPKHIVSGASFSNFASPWEGDIPGCSLTPSLGMSETILRTFGIPGQELPIERELRYPCIQSRIAKLDKQLKWVWPG